MEAKANTGEPASPDYEVVPLAREEVGVAAVQMNPKPVDAGNPKPGIRANLDRMLHLCQVASYNAWLGGPKARTDLVVFPEFTLTGRGFDWGNKEFRRVAIETPGEETEAIGKMARQLNMYIAFASHTKEEKEWPGHFFNTSMIIGPSGQLIHKHWKAHPRPSREFGTTVHDVLREFVERYGRDAVWPVARTPIGNLATFVCSEGFQPETARAFAFKGAEILCRCISMGGPLNRAGRYMIQFRGDCAANLCYGVFSNGGSGPAYGGGLTLAENSEGGGSMIVDFYGRITNQANDSREQIVFDRIPLGWLRTWRQRPFIRNEIYQLVLEDCPGKFPANLFLDYGIPQNPAEADRIVSEHANY